MNTVDLIPALIIGSIFGYYIGYLVYHSISCKHCGKKWWRTSGITHTYVKWFEADLENKARWEELTRIEGDEE